MLVVNFTEQRSLSTFLPTVAAHLRDVGPQGHLAETVGVEIKLILRVIIEMLIEKQEQTLSVIVPHFHAIDDSHLHQFNTMVHTLST